MLLSCVQIGGVTEAYYSDPALFFFFGDILLVTVCWCFCFAVMRWIDDKKQIAESMLSDRAEL